MDIKPPLPSTTLQYSRRLRREMTDAELKLWKVLRGRGLEGLKFRRQHPIPPYIADFCCVDKKLIVELDGSQHTARSDTVRTRILRSLGWTILRFWDHDVLMAIEAVVEGIWKAARGPDPHPNPSPDGRGAQATSEHDHEQ
jgi:very-short-patch-repair endonuclease